MSNNQRTCRYVWHQCSESSCGWQDPYCKNVQTSSLSPCLLSGKSGMSTCKWISNWHVASHVCFIHKSVMQSCSTVGASNNCPHNSSHIISPIAHSKKPVKSCGWLENFRRVWMCMSVYSIKRLGMLMPQNLSSPCANAYRNVQTKSANGSPCANIGDIIVWHCSWVKVVAGNGYMSFLNSTCIN